MKRMIKCNTERNQYHRALNNIIIGQVQQALENYSYDFDNGDISFEDLVDITYEHVEGPAAELACENWDLDLSKFIRYIKSNNTYVIDRITDLLDKELY